MRHLDLDLLVHINVALRLAMLTEHNMLQISTDGIDAPLADILIDSSQSHYIEECLSLHDDLVHLTSDHAAQLVRRDRLLLLSFLLVPDLD